MFYNFLTKPYGLRSIMIASKTVWFREEIVKRGIELCKIDKVDQLGDVFTKGLTRVAFDCLRKKFMFKYISPLFSFAVTLLRGSIAGVYIHTGAWVNPCTHCGFLTGVSSLSK